MKLNSKFVQKPASITANMSRAQRIEFYEEYGFDKTAKNNPDPGIRLLYYVNNSHDISYQEDCDPVLRGIMQHKNPHHDFGKNDADWYVRYSYRRSQGLN